MSTLQEPADLPELIRNSTHLDVSCMLLDLRKTFDTINHETLIFKLESYSVRGICLECSGRISMIVPKALLLIISIQAP